MDSAQRGSWSGYAFVLSAAALWAMIGPVARFPMAEGVQPLEIAFWRASLAGALYLLHSRLRGRSSIGVRDLIPIIAFGVFGVAFFFGAYLLAVEAGGAALASVLLYTAPAWVAVGAWLWLGERLERRTLLALVIAVAGLAIVALGARPGGMEQPRFSAAAIGWGLASGLAYALYYLIGKRYFGRLGTESVLAIALPVGALVLLPFVPFTQKSAMAWAVIIFVAVLPTYVAYLLYGAGLMRIPATRAATIAAVEPVVAAAVAFAIWGEQLGKWGYAGSVLVLSAVLLIATAGQNGRVPATRRVGATERVE
jgi:drug/metabolite transporter, DME family